MHNQTAKTIAITTAIMYAFNNTDAIIPTTKRTKVITIMEYIMHLGIFEAPIITKNDKTIPKTPIAQI
jgi:hypothetical protein